jgi:hypothetical protein
MTNPHDEGDSAPRSAETASLEQMEAAFRTLGKSVPFSAVDPSATFTHRDDADAAEEPPPPDEAAHYPPAAALAGAHDRLEELADDQLQVLRQVQSLAAGQADVLARLDALSRSFQQWTSALGREVAQVRAELLSRQRGLALRDLFDGMIGPWERLRSLSDAIRQPSPSRKPAVNAANLARQREALSNQLQAVVAILGRSLRDLGFEEFTAEEGQAFDPHCMECAGYATGPTGVVLKVVKPGYRAGDITVSPVQVLIADPFGSQSVSPTTGDEE